MVGRYYTSLFGGDDVTRHFVVYDVPTRAAVPAAVATMSNLLRDLDTLDARAADMSRAYGEYRRRWRDELAARMGAIS